MPQRPGPNTPIGGHERAHTHRASWRARIHKYRTAWAAPDSKEITQSPLNVLGLLGRWGPCCMSRNNGLRGRLSVTASVGSSLGLKLHRRGDRLGVQRAPSWAENSLHVLQAPPPASIALVTPAKNGHSFPCRRRGRGHPSTFAVRPGPAVRPPAVLAAKVRLNFCRTSHYPPSTDAYIPDLGHRDGVVAIGSHPRTHSIRSARPAVRCSAVERLPQSRRRPCWLLKVGYVTPHPT